ncbi:hypothetical protein JCM11251_001780 [Rhodosporidiobolus azoricus]
MAAGPSCTASLTFTGSGAMVGGARVTTGGTALGTTLSLVNISTMAEPEPASTTSSETITTSSSPAFSSSSAVILKSAGTTLAETNSQSTSVSTSVSSANSDTLNGNLTAS